jgi:predicted ATPase
MRDTIAWSYDRLEPQDQALFRRLAVFVGGAELEGWDAVCTLSTGLVDSLSSTDNLVGQNAVLEGVTALVDNSLLLPAHSPDNPARWVMSETIREYGLECLEASGEADQVRQRHAEYFLTLADQAEPALIGADQSRWLNRLDREHDNLRAAFSWITTPGRASGAEEEATALRIAPRPLGVYSRSAVVPSIITSVFSIGCSRST